MTMWPLGVVSALLAIATMSACGWEPNDSTASQAPLASDASLPTITFGDDGFEPLRLDLEAGQRVRFVNASESPMWPASNIHPTHEIYPEFDAIDPIEAGKSWVFTFERPGFWRYHNHLGPERSGIVVVSGDPIETPAPLMIVESDLAFDAAPDLSITRYVELYESDAELARFLRRHGPSAAVRALVEGAAISNADCHERAHDAGRLAYDLFGAAAFYLASHECQAGAFHGATEALFRARGTVNLREDVSTLCGLASVSFYYLQCLHGVGHGLMAWTSYELPDALALCESLNTGADHRACLSGVFMENVIGGLSGLMGHVTEYLSDDPHYPCNSLGGERVLMCYFYQSTRMMILFGNDFARVAEACGEAPELARRYCFRSMGRDVGGFSAGQPDRAIQLCGLVDGAAYRAYCIEGAAQNAFWETSGAEDALDICALPVDEGDQFACYSAIVFRAQQLYESNEAYYAFCDRVPDRFRQWCRSKSVGVAGE